MAWFPWRRKDNDTKKDEPGRGYAAGADGGPADGGPLRRGPADGGPADRSPADRGPADGGHADRGPADRARRTAAMRTVALRTAAGRTAARPPAPAPAESRPDGAGPQPAPDTSWSATSSLGWTPLKRAILWRPCRWPRTCRARPGPGCGASAKRGTAGCWTCRRRCP